MSWESLALRVAYSWVLINLAGCALAPRESTSLPGPLRAIVIHLAGSAFLAGVGLSVVAFDLSRVGTNVLYWTPLAALAISRIRGHSNASASELIRAFAKSAAPRQFVSLAALFLALAYGAHSLSVIDSSVYGDEIDWMSISKRNYRLIDGDLQYRVADSFLSDQSVEKHFLDAGLVWSAGDRPMLLATIQTALARLTGVHLLPLNRLTVILFASFVLISIFALLRHVLTLPPGPSLLVTAVAALHPFVMANIEFTWPKMAGVAFAMGGFALAVYSIREVKTSKKRGNPSLLLLAGIGIGFAPLCHGTLLFGMACFVSLVVLLCRKELAVARVRLRVLALLVLPAICFLALQSFYNANHTGSSSLGIRVALCSEGSFAHRTPPMTLSQACKKYYARKGIGGVASDRVESARRAFVSDYASFSKPYEKVSSLRDFQFVYYYRTLFTPAYAAGIWSLPLMLALAIACVSGRVRERLRRGSGFLYVLTLGYGFIGVFALMMGESSEVTALQIPFSQTLLIFVGIWAGLIQLCGRWVMIAAALYGVFCLTIFANDVALFGFIPNRALMLWSIILFGSGFACLRASEAREPLS